LAEKQPLRLLRGLFEICANPKKPQPTKTKKRKYEYAKSKKAASPESRMLSGLAALKDLLFILFFSSD